MNLTRTVTEGTSKLTKLISVIIAGLFIAATFTMLLAQVPKRGPNTKEFMHDKLDLTKEILHGLAVEDFQRIVTKSEKLSAMSRESTWEVFENPDYARYSQEFRRSVDALTKAARAKNLDGATLAYVRVTMNCVECHKFVRGKLVAIAPGVRAKS